MASPRLSAADGTGEEERAHPGTLRAFSCGKPRGGGAGDGGDNVIAGSPLVWPLAKGGRYSARRGKHPAPPDNIGPECRAIVPYRTRLVTSRPSPESASGLQTTASAPPPLLALPPPLGGGGSNGFLNGSRGASGTEIARASELPIEVFPMVFQYMDALTLCSVSAVSREWRKQGNDDRYWRRLCRARFNVTPDAFAPPPDPIKRLYQLQYGSLRAMCRGCRQRLHTAPPSISAQTSAQLLMSLMISNAM